MPKFYFKFVIKKIVPEIARSKIPSWKRHFIGNEEQQQPERMSG